MGWACFDERRREFKDCQAFHNLGLFGLLANLVRAQMLALAFRAQAEAHSTLRRQDEFFFCHFYSNVWISYFFVGRHKIKRNEKKNI